MRLPLLLLGHLWASPITVLGCLVALGGGARLSRGDPDGVLHFVAPARGPLGWFFRRFGVIAFTWGASITYAERRGPGIPRLVRHEREHVKQTMLLGPLMPFAYLGASLWQFLRGRHAYRDNWFEVRARRAE